MTELRPAVPPRLGSTSRRPAPEAAPERGASGGASILVVVPVLRRPDRAEPLVAAFHEAECDAGVRLLFVGTPADAAELEAIRVLSWAWSDVDYLIADWPAGRADWARKINLAYRETDDDWLLTGADDLCFCPGWADRALECASRTGAGVVGTNDLGNARVMRGTHATHNLVARWYADRHGTIDGPGQVVSEVYDHNFVDDELVTTARHRRLWTFCAASEVPHLHPHWGEAEWDDTYAKGQARFTADQRLFQQRRRLILRERQRRR